MAKRLHDFEQNKSDFEGNVRINNENLLLKCINVCWDMRYKKNNWENGWENGLQICV